jgi:hypothetical protein
VSRPVKSKEAPPRARGRRVSAKAALVEHRYGSIRVLRDGRVRFDARTRPGIPELDFAVSYVVGLADGTYVEDRSNYAIYARLPENSRFFMLYLEQRRVQSSCFNFKLSPRQLRKGIAILLQADEGLRPWVKAGLEQTLRALSGAGGSNPALLKAIPALLKTIATRQSSQA